MMSRADALERARAIVSGPGRVRLLVAQATREASYVDCPPPPRGYPTMGIMKDGARNDGHPLMDGVAWGQHGIAPLPDVEIFAPPQPPR